jgi:hypothetical protein
MPKKSLLLAVLLLLVCLAYMWLSHVSSQADKLRAVTVYSRSNTSLSLFREWKEAAAGHTVAINTKAFLFPEELSAYDGIMIASARLPFSVKEAEILAAYVRQGGRLMVSAHDQSTYRSLSHVFTALNIPDTVQDDPTFTNKQITAVVTDHATEIFDPGKAYGFYSVIRFSPDLCQGHALACFAREVDIGQGKVLLTLGLPLPSNAMLGRLHNMEFTVALGHWAPRLLIDEYHHFFTQKTWKDLWTRADFVVPLAGMLAGLVLCFLFGHSPFHERPLSVPLSRSYHEININIVRGLLRDPTMADDALEIQRQFLLRLFPEHEQTVEHLHQQARQHISRYAGGLARAFGQFIRFHQEQLHKRGRKANR